MLSRMRFLGLSALIILVLAIGLLWPRVRVRASDPLNQRGDDRFAAQYETVQIEGWTILVNRGLAQQQPELTKQALTLLRFQFYQISRRLPPQVVAKLRTIRFWLEEKESVPKCCSYHPNVEWLVKNGKNPAKVGCVEISNVHNFLDWTIQQPWMVLHELSHGYHQKFLQGGHQNPEIKAVYDHAMRAGLYQTLLKVNGQVKKGYASTNDKEYFAELTEAYFGTNDAFPFVRAELHDYDPMGYNLLRRVWRDPELK